MMQADGCQYRSILGGIARRAMIEKGLLIGLAARREGFLLKNRNGGEQY
jgi:hypothetical protein